MQSCDLLEIGASTYQVYNTTRSLIVASRTSADAPRARQHLTLHGGPQKGLMAAQESTVANIQDLVYRSLRSRKTAHSTHGRLTFQNRVFTKVSNSCNASSLKTQLYMSRFAPPSLGPRYYVLLKIQTATHEGSKKNGRSMTASL